MKEGQCAGPRTTLEGCICRSPMASAEKVALRRWASQNSEYWRLRMRWNHQSLLAAILSDSAWEQLRQGVTSSEEGITELVCEMSLSDCWVHY